MTLRLGRRIRWSLLALACAGVGAYLWLTRPAVLRARLTAALAGAGWRARTLGSISWLPWGTLRIEQLEIEPAGPEPIAAMPLRPARVRLDSLRIRCDLLALVTGRLRPRAVNLDGATIRLVRPASLAAGGERMRSASNGTPPRLGQWPRVRFSDVDLGIVDAGEPQTVRRRWIVRGQGRTERVGGRRRYRLRIWQQRGAAATAESALGGRGLLVEARVEVDGLTLASDWIDDEMLRSVAPPDLSSRIDTLELRGLLRLRKLRLGPDRRVWCVAQFERLAGVVPVEPEAQATARWATLHDVSGTLEYVRAPGSAAAPSVYLKARGWLNDGRLHLTFVGNGAAPHAAGRSIAIGPLRVSDYLLALKLDGLTVPDPRRDRAFVRSPKLPRPVRAFFEDYEPRGRLNADVTIRAEPPADGSQPVVRVAGRLEALEGSGRYRGFPYPLEQVRGSIRISNDGIEIEEVRGRHGPGRIILRGHVNQPRSWTGFELWIDARNAPLDETLYNALPPEFRKLWDRVDPIGLCDATIRVWRPDGSPEAGAPPPQVRLTARVLGGSLAIEDRRLEHATGTVSIDGPRIVLRPLRGFLEGMPVTLRGELRLDREHGRLLPDLTVEAADVRLHREVPVRLGDQPALGQLVFDALASATGRIQWRDGQVRQRYRLEVQDGSLTGLDGRTRWTQLAGRIEQTSDGLRLDELRGHRGGGTLRVDGLVPQDIDAPANVDLRIDAADRQVDHLLSAAIPPRWSDVQDALGLAGAGRVRARLRTGRLDPGFVEVGVELSADEMIPAVLPMWLRDVRARLTLWSDGLELLEARAWHVLGGRIALEGTGDWSARPPRAVLAARMCDLPLGPDLLVVLPAPLADLMAQLRLRARADLWLDPLRVVGGPQPRWEFSGQLDLADADMFVGFGLRGASGWVAGDGSVDAAGTTTLVARFHLDEGSLAGRPVRDWNGVLRRVPGESRVVLDQVQGQFCGGRVSGKVAVNLDSQAYELSCVLADVSIPRLLNGGSSAQAGELTGRLDGRVFLRGSMLDPAYHDGGGELRIRNAPLRAFPLTGGMTRVARARKRPIGQQVRLARLKFAWSGTRLRFSEVDLHTDRQRFVGTGWWDTASDAIEFELVEVVPENAPRVAVLTDLLEAAGQELLAYRITGTLADSKVTIEPLRRLTGPVRKLLEGTSGAGP